MTANKIVRRVVPAVVLLLAGCGSESPPATEDADAADPVLTEVSPPDAQQRPRELIEHGDVRIDNYYWLRDDDRKDPDVIAYLEAENAYTETMTAHVKTLEDTLYEEMVSRIKQDDSSVPLKVDDYWYYSRYSEGQEYPVFARRKGSEDGPEQVLVDVNELAEGYEFFQVGNYKVSDDHRIIAWAEDTVSRRQYTIRFKNLDTGGMYPDRLENASASMAWAADNRTLFYIRKDPQTLLGYQVYRHRLGTDPADDVLVYEEKDNAFYLGVFRSKSRDWIYIASSATITSEVRVLAADQPEGDFQVFLPRETGHEYSVTDAGGRFFVTTNWDAENFRVMETSLEQSADKSTWTEVIPHRDDVLIHAVEPYNDYLVINERSDATRKLRVLPRTEGGREFFIESDEAAYTMYLGANAEIDSHVLRYGYTSLTTPFSTYDYDMRSGERELKKRAPVLGDFDPANYGTERISITARDGTEVPVSIVYRKPFELYAERPLMVAGYGSYGSSRDPSFSIANLALLDRGIVYAIAHIRGGQEMGRKWYEDGKMFNKINTFTDFIDVTRGLVEKGYGDSERVFAMGGSAGGLLMGAVINMAPELYRGVIAAVPFVDVVTTMLDETIPLTSNEFDEWGNPKIKEQYDYMLSYSPYDQIKAQDYPNLLVTTGLHDSQVQYWEPAKWVAKLRDHKTDNNRLLLKTDMEVGHGGSSGRFKRYRDRAFMWAFMLDLAGFRE
ncbi:MAG: S9 family peptidase [Xanthomonadales bacterium]|nr:S9 family peptidase [Xanthomonadales bacterium]